MWLPLLLTCWAFSQEAGVSAGTSDNQPRPRPAATSSLRQQQQQQQQAPAARPKPSTAQQPKPTSKAANSPTDSLSKLQQLKGGVKREVAFPQEEHRVFGLRIGTESGSSNVVSDDNPTAPFSFHETSGIVGLENGGSYEVKEQDNSLKLFIGQSLLDNTASIMMGRPQVVVEGDGLDVLVSPLPTHSSTAQISGSGQLLSVIPDAPDELPVSLQFQCSMTEKGSRRLFVKIRFYRKPVATPTTDPSTPPEQITRKEITFAFYKTCGAGEKAAVIPGLQVVADTYPNQPVIQDGVVTAEWSNAEPIITIPVTESMIRFSITGAEGTVLELPTITALPSNILLAVDSLQQPSLTLNPNTPASLPIKIRCLAKGDAVVSVQLPVLQQSAIFSFNKKCAGVDGAEEKVYPSLAVSTTQDGSPDVVKEGKVQPSFHLQATENGAKPFNAEGKEITFYVKTNKLRVNKPMVTSHHMGNKEAKQVLNPAIESESNWGRRFLETASFTVTLSCLRKGDAVVVVSLPMHGGGAVEFAFTHACSDGDIPVDNGEYPDIDDVIPHKSDSMERIPGLNIGSKEGGSDIVQDGIPTSYYHWDSDWLDLAMVPGERTFMNFYISYDTSNEHDDEAAVTLGQPELLSSLDIFSAVLTGSVGSGVTLTSPRGSAVLSVTFHCLSNGTSQMTLVIPLLPTPAESLETAFSTGVSSQPLPSDSPAEEYEYDAAPARSEPIKINFIKGCPEEPAVLQSGLGGVGVPGLNIGTQDPTKCKKDDPTCGMDVVYNGFPTEKYFGQRTKENPEWKEVDEKEISTTLYLSYSGAGPVSTVEFRAPYVVAHGKVANPTLSGPASKGGALVLDGKPLALDIAWQCQFEGILAATVAVPVSTIGTISFTIPKKCAGGKAQGPVSIPGLHVQLDDGTAVVENGITTKQFLPYAKHATSNYHAGPQEMATTFWIKKQGPPPMKALEPMAFSNRPVVTPVIEHSLHVDAKAVDAEAAEKKKKKDKATTTKTAAQKKGEEEEEKEQIAEAKMLEIVIGEEWQPINITYNCLWDDGDTAITVVIGLEPTGKLRWTWSKACPRQVAAGWDDDDEYADYDIDDGDFFGEIDNADGDFDGYGGITEPDDDDEDYYADMRKVGNNDHWSAIDEGRWNPDVEDEDPEAGGSQRFINIGTSPTDQDVISDGVPNERFTNIATAEGGASPYLVGRQESTKTFYLTVPEKPQQFETPLLMTQDRSEKVVAKPELSGSALAADRIEPGETLELTVTFNCVAPGVVPVLVTIPFLPRWYGYAGFRVLKVCGGFQKKTSFAWTANTLLIICGLFGVCCLGLIGWFMYRKVTRTNKYEPVRRREEEDGDLADQKLPKELGVELDKLDADDSD